LGKAPSFHNCPFEPGIVNLGARNKKCLTTYKPARFGAGSYNLI
jgi:hypothetical protein